MAVFTADNDDDALEQALGYTGDVVKLLELHQLDNDHEFVRSVNLAPNRNGLIIEYPIEGFAPDKVDNLRKMVAAKASLLKAALGTDELHIIRECDVLQFPWFPADSDAEHISAYSMLVSLLCKAAKGQKRVTAKEKAVDNEKFAFRVFLIRLGFVGPEYKASRRVLMRNLSGNSAFKNGTPPKTSENESVSDD